MLPTWTEYAWLLWLLAVSCAFVWAVWPFARDQVQRRARRRSRRTTRRETA